LPVGGLGRCEGQQPVGLGFDGRTGSLGELVRGLDLEHGGLPESEYPDAARILARLVVSQFVQITSAADADRSIYKGLVIDEAGRFVDDYVARGVQTLRSNNAGLVLLSQWFGDHYVTELSHTRGQTATVAWQDPRLQIGIGVDEGGMDVDIGYDPGRVTHGVGSISSTTTRRIERPRWSVSDIITGIPTGHAP
jgi:hypothetical protein